MTSEVTLLATAQQINLLVVVDTEYVKGITKAPSKDWKNPTGINHSGQFMLCTGSRGPVKGQGTGDLEFMAYPGDLVSFTGTSIYDNSDDAVIVYGIKHFAGDTVFNYPFNYSALQRNGAAQPNPESPDHNGLPAVQKPENFPSLDSRVARSGREGFGICFGLYTLVGGQKQELYGYYWWDPYVTVAG